MLTIAEDSHQLIKFFNTETEKLTQRIHALSYELRSKLKLINALFDNSPVGMMVLDEKSTIMQINKAGMKILGATSSLIGISCNHFYDAGASEFNQTGKSVIEPLETSAVTESGDEITILRCSVRAKDEEKLVYETFVDITEIEKARINSERAKQAAEKANQAKTDFLANVTHELQTPLNIIMGYSQLGMMLDEDVPLDEIKKSFHKIMVSSEDLKSFIGSLLDISKANAGKLSFNKQKEFLRCVIKQAVDECSVLCNDKGIVVNQDLSDMIGLYNLDAGRFKQVIRNLLTNAIHFSPDNSEIRITGRVIDDFIDIRVMDSGPGIPDEELGKIFGKFEQSSIKVDGAGGTGLGLFICHEIIAAHNGSIYAENRQQGGAKFIIRLPLLASN